MPGTRDYEELAKVLDRVYDYIDDHFDTEYLPNIQALVRQPSVAAERTGIGECAALVRDSIARLGSADVQLARYGEGSPVVFGTVPASVPNARTVLMYGMYDVQPPDPIEDWTVPPYDAVIKDVDPFGACVVGRGVTNSKGPLVCFFSAVDALQKSGGLPVNVLFVVEGEEELGSQSLIPFTKEHRDYLAQSDGVYLNGARQDEHGRPVVLLGNKGMLYLELEARGGEWGGPRSVDVHAMNAAWLDSPVWRLINALSTLRPTLDQVAIAGFYDDVRPPTARDEELLRALAQTFDESMFLERLDAHHFRRGLHGVDALREFLFTPTLNIDGIWSGYSGPATKTILPHKAQAKVDVRLVPDMRPTDIAGKVRQHLDHAGFGDVSVNVRTASDWSKTDPDHPMARAAMAAMRATGLADAQVWPLLPGTGPAYLFTRPPLSLPFVSYGLGHGGRIHAPDEYYVLDGLRDNVKSSASFLLHYAAEEA
jgi:acetylornithine deacetylase/succinyl-diaminopimelate desuccinylase-like protein